MKILNINAKRNLLHVFLWVVLMMPVISVQAECRLNGVDNGGDVGTILPDKIICNASNLPVGSVDGQFSDDIIKIRSVAYNVNGGDGDDDIFVRVNNGLVIGDITGDSQFFNASFGNYGIGAFGFYQGGDDIITVDGTALEAVYGEFISAVNFNNVNATLMGGADTINMSGAANGTVLGDGIINVGDNSSFSNFAGADTFNISGATSARIIGDEIHNDISSNSTFFNAGGADSIQVSGTVSRIYGDFYQVSGGGQNIVSAYFGGGDTITIDGTVENEIYGDFANIDSDENDFTLIRDGSDSIQIGETGSVGEDLFGDYLHVEGSNNIFKQFNAGDDTIIISGEVGRFIYGEYALAEGSNNVFNEYYAGDDRIVIEEDGAVGQIVYGEYIWLDGKGTRYVGGDDEIIVNGAAFEILGDALILGLSTTSNPSSIGGDDVIKVYGTMRGGIVGDYFLLVGPDADITDWEGGDDTIVVDGTVESYIVGDHFRISPANFTAENVIGGDDRIIINGTVNYYITGEHLQAVSPNNITNSVGGNDTIVVNSGGLVNDDIFGDDPVRRIRTGGDDIIRVKEGATVSGSVIGDNVSGQGGDDIIRIRGTVNGNVVGDQAGTPGNDIIRIYATAVVGGSVCGDNLIPCNNNGVVVFDENTNPNQDGEDVIVIAGKVLGNVIAGANFGAQADDVVVIVEGAEIGGTIYAGDEAGGDRLIYVENIINEEKTVSDVVNGVTEQNGKVRVNGVTYTLDGVEYVSGAVGQIACFGMDYRVNKTSDGCSARSQSEKDAIQWHRDNPGADGRLPGLESCAVYSYGNALRVYEIVDGSEGELVAEIWGDVLSNAPATNELLGQTADGNIALYHLTSGELQIECRNLVDGKTQVRVLSDLAGTVANAYDKS